MNRSSQREAILEKLRQVTCHPTADELHEMLHEGMPHLSLATVYRNLEQLAKAGMVKILDGAGARRFDGNIVPHHHKRCCVCGCVSDLESVELAALDRTISTLLPRIGCVSCSIEFAGTCESCREPLPEKAAFRQNKCGISAD